LTLVTAVSFAANSQALAPAGLWVMGPTLPSAHSEVGVATVNGKVYIVGGTVDTGTMSLSLNEEYDPASKRARERAPLPQPLSHVCVVGLNGKIYVVGGFSDLDRVPRSGVRVSLDAGWASAGDDR
jgi:hypothetical protein